MSYPHARDISVDFPFYCPLPDLLVISHNRLRSFRTYDRQIAHISQLTYGLCATNGIRMEHPHFMVDIQNMSALQKTVRTT